MHERLIIRLVQKLLGVNSTEILNPPADVTRQPARIPGLMRQMQLVLESAAHLDGQFDYQALAKTEAYQQFRDSIRGLADMDLHMLESEAAKKAFWINLYNILILDAVLHYAIIDSVQDVPGLFMRAAYQLGGQRFSADDIEHGVLRANRGHPAIPGPQFARGDPRCNLILADLDPRIHFALNCGAEACPPIGIYRAEVIDQQLDLAARSFIQGGAVQCDREGGVVALSAIFRWYAPDFGGPLYALGNMQPLLNFIAQYCSPNDQDFLLEGRPQIKFQKYNWSLNSRISKAGPILTASPVPEDRRK